jgi:hypothetical protein
MRKEKPKHRSMYFTEGNPLALIVTETCKGFCRSHTAFESAQAALQWCRLNNCSMIYLPNDALISN